MSGKSKISYVDRTWECVRGCYPASAGCDHCYAARLTWRLANNPATQSKYQGLIVLASRRRGLYPTWTGKVICDPPELSKPLHWRKPQRIFVCSRSDLFHPEVPAEFIAAVFGVMAACPQHTFLVLTKRSERMTRWFGSMHEDEVTRCFDAATTNYVDRLDIRDFRTWPLPNVWIGVTAENQEQADKRIPDLLATPAAVRWVSVEPMLGKIDLECWTETGCPRGWVDEHPGIDWVVAGCESGPGARPASIEWFRQLRDQCRSVGAAFWFKQAMVDGKLVHRPALDGRTWEQLPEGKR